MSTKLKSPSKAVPVAESTAPAASSSKSQASSGSPSSSSKTTTKVVTQVVKEPVVIEVPTGYQVAESPQIAARDIASPDIEKIDKVDITERKAQLQQNAEDRAATIGRAMLSAGVTPSAAMLSAMGMTPTDYLNYRLSNL